ncbi:DinB family protein [Actinomycetospora soli]|uniref:DinB family protein n=1 Tax=Actinomycetospora soli TaxID=2893887 RepID=UPI001E2B2A00|nr:DinB family protein [Actinomycetospora soli]MCD2186398.1 DinB family protein [Actinomycetospora soli]
MAVQWNPLLVDQLEFQWSTSLRPKLDGLTDAEYLWEPGPGAWTVRSRAEAVTRPWGGGDMVLDLEVPAPEPPPVTTIAWRMAHVIVGCLGVRTASHFGGPADDVATHRYAATADEALEQLDAAHDRWVAGVRALGEEGLVRPCGPAEGPFAAEPMAVLVLHIHREVIHHGAEILLLRDLYRVSRG